MGDRTACLVCEISAGWAVNCVWGADCFGDDIFSARFGDAGIVEEVEKGHSHFLMEYP